MKKRRRGFSAGTVLMLALLLVTLSSYTYIYLKLRSGGSADFAALSRQVMDLNGKDETGTEAKPVPRTEGSEPPSEKRGTASPVPTEDTHSRAEQTVKLTVGGTAAIEKNIRQSAYAADTQVYDFSEIMTLLRPEITGDINALFLENLLLDDGKVNGVVVPACAADLASSAGFDTALAGFSKAWLRDAAGIQSTCASLEQGGLSTLGLFPSQGKSQYLIREVHGIRIALMQFTSTVSSSDRKKMNKKDAGWMIPEADPEKIAEQIRSARTAGADIVVVFLHWGKIGAKAPDKSQITLAQQIADSGADAIIGAGARIAQKVEFLQSSDSRSVLCAWSLGTLISDERKPVNRIGGFLLHLTFAVNAQGEAALKECAYTPVYTWSYRQDNKTYYKCLSAEKEAPDGMDSEQIKTREKTLEAVRTALKDFPVLPGESTQE